MEPKKYGLIIPKKEKKEIVSKINLFSKDTSDDESLVCNPSKLTSVLYKEKFLKKQTQLNIEKALNEDPNCFEYDDVYDDIQSNKFSSKAKTLNDKKPKYIEKLMQTAQERKKEYERRVERQVQRDRESEKGMYDDKEAYVTDAYRTKMQMLKEEEEIELKKQMLEEQNDVTRKSDFSEFYRHILDQQTASNSHNPSNNASQIKQELKSNKSILQSSHNSISMQELSSSESDTQNKINKYLKTNDNVTQGLNLDADDSDVNDDLSSDSDDSRDNNASSDVNDLTTKHVIKENVDRVRTVNKTSNDNLKVDNVDKIEENKLKHDKRTVGESLSDARARYLARKNGTCVPVYDN